MRSKTAAIGTPKRQNMSKRATGLILGQPPRHDPGFGCTECQAAFLKKLLYPWSGRGFQYFPCWSRDHKVIGIAHDRYALMHASAFGWFSWSSIGIFCVEQPFPPIQCHVRQQWGHDSPLRRPRVCRREDAHFDYSCFQPAGQRGGEYRQLGH